MQLPVIQFTSNQIEQRARPNAEFYHAETTFQRVNRCTLDPHPGCSSEIPIVDTYCICQRLIQFGLAKEEKDTRENGK